MIPSPWLDACLRPRATIRAILDEDAERHVTALMLAAPVGLVIVAVMLRLYSSSLPLRLALAPLVLAIAALGSLLGIHLLAIVTTWTGRRLGGTGTLSDVRCALAWGLIPVFVLPLLTAPVVFAIWAPYGPHWRTRQDTWELTILVVAIAVAAYQLAGLAAAHRFTIESAVYTLLLAVGSIVVAGAVVYFALAIAYEDDFVATTIARWMG